MILRILGTLLPVSALAVGCASEPALEPPTLHLGQDLCDVCGMIISEERFAAAAIVEDPSGDRARQRFDDIGCMLAPRRNPDRRIVIRYVHDFETLDWLGADRATYLQSRELMTPMLFGLAAFSDREQAERLQERFPGDILQLPELVARAAGGDLEPATPGRRSPEEP